MDERHNNIDPRNRSGMNGRHDPMKTADEQAVFARLFALDQQPDPAPEFVARLGQSLMPSTGRMTLLSATTSTGESIQLPQLQTEASGGGKRRRPLISFGSAAVLMVVVVLVGYLVTLWAVNNSNDDPANMAFASTFEATGTAEAGFGDCVVAPRTIDNITAIVSTASNPSTQPDTAPLDMETYDITQLFAPPAGTPVSGDVVAELQRVFNIYVGCVNSRDYLRAYALFTDDGVARAFVQFNPDGSIRVNVHGLAILGLEPQEGYRERTPEEFTRVERLPDGRMIAYYLRPGYGPEMKESNFVIFTSLGGVWYIDQLMDGQG